jgi:hypothetical protein
LEGDTSIHYKTPKSALSRKRTIESSSDFINTPKLKSISEISTPSNGKPSSASLNKSRIIKKVFFFVSLFHYV